jgi:AcrR family transcriptional regulator
MGMKKAQEAVATGRPYGGIPHEARTAERREALIAAGSQVFGTVGFRKATVRAICQEAGLNDRYFYAAFDNTDALLRSTYEHHAEHLHGKLQRAIETHADQLEARVNAGLQAFFSFLRDPCAARVLLLEVMGVSAATDAAYQRHISAFAQQVICSASPATRDAIGDLADQRVVGFALVGAMINAGTAWLLSGYRDPEETMVRNCSKVFLGTFAYMTPTARR